MNENDTSVSRKPGELWKVIGASSLGTLIEWYDFYIFGSLAVIISTKFFPSDNPTAAFLSTLATFAAGFVVRPFGALFFGRLGDIIGRKYTFLTTLLVMGLSTVAIGLIPEYKTIGFVAPILVLILRLLQGLALGGEYGGAATYVSEHAEPHRRGERTSWIQTTASFGLFISLAVILLTRNAMSNEAFLEWGWRVPFLISIFMVIVSYFIRRNMDESPLFKKIKTEGKLSSNPLKESFGNRYNLKFVLLALFGAAMGQGVVFYTGQFYTLSFLQRVCNIDFDQTNYIVGIAIFLGTGMFIFFGWLSDKVGRKVIMMSGMLLAILTYRPIYDKLYQIADVDQKKEITAKGYTSEKTEPVLDGDFGANEAKILTRYRFYADGTQLADVRKEYLDPQTGNTVYTSESLSVKLTKDNMSLMVLLIFLQVLYVTMVYGPIAAFLVEMFPVKIRYTSMSLPYHIGNGIFGGLMPTVATYLVARAQTANELAAERGEQLPFDKPYLEGLWYPIIITGVSFLIGVLYISNKKRIDV
ncbi:MHS family MFS transporter [Olivibacter sp. SDN3]|uniref:MFS transporter n=1 Tax=Olivibacter sp. SDN3 TaxID=2764720 RepID=UPI00165194BE|nr:MFS transporter [Olivibacter sp. SDN3]QNL49980.1 MHS family MFS transporter [Olivibacter sp. SDN3]